MLIDTLGDTIKRGGALAVRREGPARWITTLKAFPILPQWRPAPPLPSPACHAPPARVGAGDRVVGEYRGLVGVTLPYQGHRRMTLTYTALARAARILWLVTGADKQQPLGRLLSGDRSIPAGRVGAGHSLVMADAQEAERVRGVAPAHRDGDQG